MRPALVMIFVVNFMLGSTLAMQTSRIPAKTQGCVEEDNCGPLCEYEGQKFFPGSNKTLYRDFTCLLMTCADDFYVEFEPCWFDYSGHCHFENYNNTTLYPDCCGIKVCM